MHIIYYLHINNVQIHIIQFEEKENINKFNRHISRMMNQQLMSLKTKNDIEKCLVESYMCILVDNVHNYMRI